MFAMSISFFQNKKKIDKGLIFKLNVKKKSIYTEQSDKK